MSPEESRSLAARDCRIIRALAEQSRASIGVVELIYLDELRQLEPARVTQFLPVIVGRRVRDRLRAMTKPATAQRFPEGYLSRLAFEPSDEMFSAMAEKMEREVE